MKFKNKYGVVVTIIEIDKLGNITYKREFDNIVYWDCVSSKSFYNFITLNEYQIMEGGE